MQREVNECPKTTLEEKKAFEAFIKTMVKLALKYGDKVIQSCSNEKTYTA